MTRSKGIPTYTLDSVAFPHAPKARGETDTLAVSFDAKGGGTHGEFRFDWHKFPDGSEAVSMTVFTDSFPQLMDERVQGVLARIRSMGRDQRSAMTTEHLIRLLEREGVRPSVYHLRGLLDSHALSHDETVKARAAIEKLRKHEEWSR